MSVAMANLWLEAERALERWRELQKRRAELQRKVAEASTEGNGVNEE